MNREDNLAVLADIKHVEIVSIGSINPNSTISDKEEAAQLEKLNHLLNGYPKGTIIGKNISIGRYRVGEHELTMERTTYHIGFTRKPGVAP